MARLRTDWILFLTIVAMVFFGLVMLYSASSAVAELRYHVAPYYFVVRQIGWAFVSFLVLMYFKRMDYQRSGCYRVGVLRAWESCWGCWWWCILSIARAPLVLNCRASDRFTVGIRQARVDSFSGVLHRAAHAHYPSTAAR